MTMMMKWMSHRLWAETMQKSCLKSLPPITKCHWNLVAKAKKFKGEKGGKGKGKDGKGKGGKGKDKGRTRRPCSHGRNLSDVVDTPNCCLFFAIVLLLRCACS